MNPPSISLVSLEHQLPRASVRLLPQPSPIHALSLTWCSGAGLLLPINVLQLLNEKYLILPLLEQKRHHSEQRGQDRAVAPAKQAAAVGEMEKLTLSCYGQNPVGAAGAQRS
ncbi:acetylcholine receptor subunit delta [Platysternon megacephalum]|uniref:Acetylcholine receptor subunit delta n=1 Tax=Platysternon megacephalum TaxID=55544 RepID=A0A4D9EBR6_9SAUR|nr:acetylcholine receptor subunit delta [Platysternon megacephalum]